MNVSNYKNELNCLYFNVCSLLPKLDNLRITCNLYSPDVVCIVETWLDSIIDDSEIHIQGYSVTRLDRTRHGGGVLIYVKNIYSCSLLFKGSPEFECIIMSVCYSTIVSPAFCIAVFYRPPSSGVELLDNLFSTLCNIFTSVSSNYFYLIGDFNIDFLTHSHPFYQKLLSVVSSFNLTQIVSEPTRVTNHSSTLIDLIFVSSLITVQSCTTIPPLANADHFGLHLIVCTKFPKKRAESVPRKVWRYSLADFDRAAEMLESIEWNTLLPSEADSYWKAWKTYFLQIMELCVPHAIVKPKSNVPWMNHCLTTAIRKRNILFRMAKRTGKASDRVKYNRQRNRVVTMLRNAKQLFFDKLNAADTKTFWKTVRQLNQQHSSIPVLKDNGITVESSADKAALLNNYFYTCFNHSQISREHSTSSFDSLSPSDFPEDLLCNEDFTENTLSNLDVAKSTGIDGVAAKMLKYTASSIAPSLTTLFNLSISTGIFPTEWKIARIVPVPKCADKELPSSYRPISVLLFISKVMERHVKNLIEDHLQLNAPISPRQWGFMTSRSTTSALIRVVNDWSQALDKGYEVCVIFFDVRKAFDSVPHALLLQKMRELGLDPYLIRWIQNYLLHRQQHVAIDGHDSHSLPVVSGVPQGSVLGPLLFITYINDVTSVISSDSELNMFADDIALYRVIRSPEDYIGLQSDINSLSLCVSGKQLQFNEEKCKVMFISRKRTQSLQPPPLTVNGSVLAHCTSYKYLGVCITTDLCWSPHINKICNNSRRLIGLIYRRFHRHSNPPSLLKLYISYIRPHLEYSSTVWSPHLKSNIKAIENVQKFALRVSLKTWDSNYQNLLTMSSLPTLLSRRIQARLCHLYKIVNGITEFPDAPIEHKVPRYSNRSANMATLSVPRFKTNSYQFSFFPETISMWNKLPKYIVESDSLTLFKHRLVNYFKL